jgi:rhodanese-related sulfurtransferase
MEDTENLGVGEVAAELDDGAVLVDIREAAERKEHGVIPGARHIPMGELESVDDLHRDERLILHCAAGGRSAKAIKFLRAKGYTNVAHLAGGFTAWKEAGKDVEQPS